VTSWKEFADAIFEHIAELGGRRPRVDPIPTSGYPTKAVRPARSELDCTKIRLAFGLSSPPWRASLERVVEQIMKGSGSS